MVLFIFLGLEDDLKFSFLGLEEEFKRVFISVYLGLEEDMKAAKEKERERVWREEARIREELR